MLAGLASGELDRLVVIGAPPAALGHACAAAPELGGRIFVRCGADEPLPPCVQRLPADATLTTVLGRGLGVSTITPTGAPAAVPLRPGDLGQLLGAAADLLPTLRLRFECEDGSVGVVCLCDGLIRAAGRTGSPLAANPVVRRDESLKLLLDLWFDDPAHDLDLQREVELVCEYGALFAASDAYRAHVVETVAGILGSAAHVVRVDGHEPGQEGAPIGRVLLDALARDDGALAEQILPTVGEISAPAGIPRYLRDALPAARFGRVFFELDGPKPVADVVASSRLPEHEVRAALALVRLAGGLPSEGHLEPPPLPDDADAVRPQASPRTGRRLRVTTHQDSAGQALSQSLCGDAKRFVLALRRGAELVRANARSPRIAGTRFEPLGEIHAGLISFVRLTRGVTTSSDLVAQRAPDGQVRVVVLKSGFTAIAQDPGARERFLAACRGAAALSRDEHDGVVAVYDVLEPDDGGLGVLLEFVHGLSAAELIRDADAHARPLAVETVAWIGAAAASTLHLALRRATALRLVAPSLEPRHVLLSFDGAVKLAGFVPAGRELPRPVGPEGPIEAQIALAATLEALASAGRPAGAPLPPALAGVLSGVRAGRGFASCDALAQALRLLAVAEPDPRGLVAAATRQAAGDTLLNELSVVSRVERSARALFERAREDAAFGGSMSRGGGG
ncbi:MAG: hypothetical protein H6745_20345 [Deltaproteobacteria bacterium]|nr:hypothetical protein [Deltaproteobacteria bacterium]